MWNELLRPFRYPRLTDHGAQNQERGAKLNKQRARNWVDTVKRIWSYLADYRWSITTVLLMVMLSTGLALTGPFLVGMAIDDYLTTRELGGLPLLLAGLALVYLLHSLTVWLQNFWMIGIAQQTVLKMRKQLFAKLHQIAIPYFDKKQHGELMSRMTNDIENVSSTLNSSVIQIFSSILMLIGTVSVMLYLSPLLSLLTFLIIPLMVLGMRWITSRTSRMFRLQQRNLGQLNGFIEETVSGQGIVKTFSQEERVIAQFAEKNRAYQQAGFWAQAISGFIPKLMNALNNLSFAIIAGVGGLLAYYGHMSIGSIIIFVEFARQFTRPLHDLSNQLNTLLSAVAGAERVFEVLDESEEGRGDEGAVDIDHVRGEVEFKQVSFGYNEDGHTLKAISFRASPGETIALVGPTGAGKTTVINLLARFYEPDSGEIRIDGKPITAITRASWRSHLAVVLQDPFLFHGTVRDNIRFGRPDASDEEVIEAARLANAHSFIMKLPKGYDTVVSQEGTGISQGQKQLLSIARAVLARPSVLILDEATSNIDTVTEINIQEAMRRLMAGRTSFVIAHRLNTIREADQILVLRAGRIIERGTHEALLESRGFYYKLHHPNQS